MTQRWKIGLPMYQSHPQSQKLYSQFLQYLIIELKQLGFRDAIDIVQIFPQNLYEWWLDENVLFSQTCGYPYITGLKDQVQLLATPCFNTLGCQGPLYRSAFITHMQHQWRSLKEAKNTRVVINQHDSNSGLNLLRAEIAQHNLPKQNFFSAVYWSGSHLNSLTMIHDQVADLASIDCISLAYAQKYSPELFENIRVIHYSQTTFGLPYIASKQVTPDIKKILIQSLYHILHNHPKLCEELMIEDFIQAQPSDYLKILELEQYAHQQNYYELNTFS